MSLKRKVLTMNCMTLRGGFLKRLRPLALGGCLWAVAAGSALAQQPQPSAAPTADTGPVYHLEQFGPVGSRAAADAAFQKASKDIIAAGGGVLLIPGDAAADWQPRNNTQEQVRTPPAPAPAKNWRNGVGVTVVDMRGGTLKIKPPQATGIQIERTLDLPEGQSLSFWNYFPMLELRNTVLHGSTSYREWLQEEVKAGPDRRFYISTIRGVFPGMFMSGGEYGVVQRLYVKSLGYDAAKKMWYFVADAEADMPKGAMLGNKNHVNVLDMQTTSHNENQTFDVRMWRYNYSQGDNYLFDARFKYMGDVHSTAGDENGVLYAAFVEPLTDIFRGLVEKWDAASGELIFKNSEGKTLGSGRPIINMNPVKWITKGTAAIVAPASATDTNPLMANPVYQGKTYPTSVDKNNLGIPSLRMGGLIRLSAEAPVTEEAVGRYFAVDEDGEYVPKTKQVRRWYLIDSVTKNADGTKDLRIIRHWWGAKSAGSPTLYKPENYSADGHEKPLRYIIAPGVNAYDVSDGVGASKHLIRLSPSPFVGSPADFAPGDAIEQAIGPDPFKPTLFRGWMWDDVPGAFPSAAFDIANNGSVMRDSLFWVHGNSSGNIDTDRTNHYDRNPPWNKLFSFESTCNVGFAFKADTAEAALLFYQPNGHAQPIKWQYSPLPGLPTMQASLTVSPVSGEMAFSGGARFGGSLGAAGLSGEAMPARNLRGKDIPVKAGETRLTVTFPNEEADASYAVFIEQSWLSNRAIIKKEAKGFTVEFEKPAPAEARLDWFLVR